MHLWSFRRAGIQIWDFWMLKMSDTGNHNESSPIPNSAETVIPKPSKPCVTLQAIFERCVYFAVHRIFPRRGLMTRSHPQLTVWRLYVHLYSVHYIKYLNMPEN